MRDHIAGVQNTRPNHFACNYVSIISSNTGPYADILKGGSFPFTSFPLPSPPFPSLLPFPSTSCTIFNNNNNNNNTYRPLSAYRWHS